MRSVSYEAALCLPHVPKTLAHLEDESSGCQRFMHSDCSYGARRVWLDVLEQGTPRGLYCIERLMREQALRALPLPKGQGERSAIAETYGTANSTPMHRTEAGSQLHLHLDCRRLTARCRGGEPVLATHRGLFNAREHDLATHGGL